MSFSDYVAYFDESGDHGLKTIDLDFPVFVLCGCLFNIHSFLRDDLRRFTKIKFRHFGHDAVVFHSRDIRKRVGPFQVLSDGETQKRFIKNISSFFESTSGTIIAAGIHKGRHKRQYAYPDNPYDIALLFCLERIYAQLRDMKEEPGPMTCVFERRGEVEDNALAGAFAEICNGNNRWGKLPFQLVFASKLTNMAGLQIADLAAYPIARHLIDPKAKNPAYDVIEPRIRRSPKGVVDGWGLKSFP